MRAYGEDSARAPVPADASTMDGRETDALTLEFPSVALVDADDIDDAILALVRSDVGAARDRRALGYSVRLLRLRESRTTRGAGDTKSRLEDSSGEGFDSTTRRARAARLETARSRRRVRDATNRTYRLTLCCMTMKDACLRATVAMNACGLNVFEMKSYKGTRLRTLYTFTASGRFRRRDIRDNLEDVLGTQLEFHFRASTSFAAS